MEPRTIHEQPAQLGAWLQDRCHEGLEVPEADTVKSDTKGFGKTAGDEGFEARVGIEPA